MKNFKKIYADTELPHRARSVYIYLCDRSNKDGSCWPGLKKISSDLNLSRSTVKRAIKDLEQRGYVEKKPRYRENGSNSSNLYVVK